MRLSHAKDTRRTLATAAARATAATILLAGGAFAAFTAIAPSHVSAAIQTGDCSPAGSWPADNGNFASQVIALINQHRVSIGEGQLVSSPTLSASAVWKARHMANFNYFSHDDPGPPTATTPARTFADRLQTCGYHYGAGENIAEGFPDAQSAVNAWLNSPGHKANIENGSYVATGVGVAEAGNGEIYWVQDFGVVADSGSPPPPPTTTSQPPPTTTTATVTTTTTARTTTTTTTTTSPSGGGGGGGTTTTSPSGTSSPSGSSSNAPAGHLSLTSARMTVGTHRLLLATKVGGSGSAPAKAAVKCVARIGARNLRVVVNAYHGHLAHCAWRLPAHLRQGTVARGFIRVHADGLHVRSTFRLVVRPA